MFGWFKKNKKDSKKNLIPPKIDKEKDFDSEEDNSVIELPTSVVSIRESSDEIGIVVDSDKLGEAGKKEFFKKLSERSKIPFFKGEVKYGYDLAKVKSKERCPRCEKDLHQHYSDIVYSNGEVSRVNTSPFGYFCEACPTAVIDVKKMSHSLSENVEFHGIAGLDIPPKGFTIFELWNDEKLVFILDEEENMAGVTTRAAIDSNPETYGDFYASWKDAPQRPRTLPKMAKKKSQNRKRNKSAKNSRKSNRKKK